MKDWFVSESEKYLSDMEVFSNNAQCSVICLVFEKAEIQCDLTIRDDEEQLFLKTRCAFCRLGEVMRERNRDENPAKEEMICKESYSKFPKNG